MDIIVRILLETWSLALDMAPYLLFGFLCAGILYVALPRGGIYRHLSSSDLLSTLKAALVGVPLPLCSCGVIPVAAHLRKEGASTSATLSFLVSTPITGVDSILATYALLGPVFAVARPVAAFAAGMLAGVLGTPAGARRRPAPPVSFTCALCGETEPHAHGLREKTVRALQYAFVELAGEAGGWLTIGLLAGGVIAALAPADAVSGWLGNPVFAYPLMLLVGIPLYVCATGSIPVAAALVAKGMAPGAAVVFLCAGPATNTATISFVLGKLGRRALAAYLAAIAVVSVAAGLAIDRFFAVSGRAAHHAPGGALLPEPVRIAAAILLAAAVIRASVRRPAGIAAPRVIIKVPDMTCRRCAAAVEAAAARVPGAAAATVDLRRKTVSVAGTPDRAAVAAAIREAGFSPAGDGGVTDREG